MTKEKWQTILGNIKDGFDVEDQGEEHIDDEGGVDIEGVAQEYAKKMGGINTDPGPHPFHHGTRRIR